MIGALPDSLPLAQALVDPAMREALGRLSPEVGRVAAYHAGLADEAGRPCERSGGKAVRPALVLLSAQAAGAPPERAVPAALAVELVHDFSLLHDDVMDHDPDRRHRPAAWTLFGIGNAIIAGDALLALAQDLLLHADGDRGVAAAAALLRATERMIEGQGQDLAFEGRDDVSTEECLAMVRNKTGALLACAASIGAIVAGGREALVTQLHAFGLHLGVAFQAIDDVLGIWGDPAVTGKPVGNDLRQRKKTLPVVAALERSDAGAERLRSLLREGPLTEDGVRTAIQLVEAGGGREATLAIADRHTALAEHSLDAAAIPPSVRRGFDELAGFVLRRDF